MTTTSLEARRALVLAMLGTAAWAPVAAQAPLMPIRLSLVPIFDLSAVYAALQEGYFKAEGLDVTTQPTQQGGAVGIPGVMAGSFDVAHSNGPSILLAIQQGLDVRVIAGSSITGSLPPDPAGLLSRKADGLRSGKDMAGKSIAVNARNGINWLLARAWVRATGGDPDHTSYREVPIPQSLDALKTRQVDAILAVDPFLTMGRSDPDLEVLGWPLSTVTPKIQAGFFVVSAAMAKARPDAVEKFCAALKKGSDWVNANLGKEPYFKLVNGFTRLDPALIAMLKVPPSQTLVDVESLRRWGSLMRDNGLLAGDIDIASKVINN